MGEIFNKLNQLINQKEYRIIIIAVVALLVLLVVFLIYRAIRLKRFRKQIVEIENKMNATKSLPLQYR